MYFIVIGTDCRNHGPPSNSLRQSDISMDLCASKYRQAIMEYHNDSNKNNQDGYIK